ncbi:methylhydantoinase [Siccirubricoccus deserti]|uniref:Hydantoinase/oxoprolinase family protein n=1 Tax=Siccirubricoccus deserti TaxID=2013562 RepID=A0A9X0UC01_9PROT|nr:hydantoinase/oxoprolinase family protein [Siccirubricoccus deserti]MBC4013901.1 hydantoinase/oxoprolinase family protein [Siccirubricoccus deserti]GGC30404.1 methylhydantoinase [Siccirubricoccus deserti]
MTARLAVDIGGTFTDVAVEQDEQRWTGKVLTTPHAPELGVLEGVRVVLEKAGLAPVDIALVIHGTTLATNAVIERKGAKTALLTTEGFRDVLALGNESRYDQYDLNIDLPQPLVPRRWRLPVPERLDNTGKVLLALDEAAVERHVGFMRAEGIEAVAIGFLHGFVNPAHERQAATIIRRLWPEVPVSLSSEVSPEMREWERFSTTVANAYVQPLMASYLGRLETELRAAGLTCPLFMMLSGGGLTTLDTAARFPIRLVESGPAGGAIFSAHVARQRGFEKVLSFDMGGTTAKVCLIDDYQPQASRSFEVARVGRFKKGSGLPLRIPVIEMVEIGAGGGSIAAVDSMGRITVGPESAGADPGPACYGRGGSKPAVTDANLALGRYDPLLFAGGALRLYPEASRDALAAEVGGKLGLSADMAALGVVEMVDENMSNAARVHAIESGKGFGGRTIIAFGGGGPVHGYRVAEKIGVKRMLVPSGAGVGSAIGFLRAPVAYEVVKSLYQRFASFDVLAVNALLAGMANEAAAVVAKGAFDAPTRESRIAYMRYVGQGHEIAVPLPPRDMTEADVREIRALYDREYTRFYDRPVPGSDVEILSFAVTVATVVEAVEPVAEVAAAPAPAPIRHQAVRDTTTGEVTEWAIYDRATLFPGATVQGPCIVTEAETSTMVGRGWVCRMDGLGYLDLTQEA